MSKVVALLVGVSKYIDNQDLKLVVNDLEIMKEALMVNLCIRGFKYINMCFDGKEF